MIKESHKEMNLKQFRFRIIVAYSEGQGLGSANNVYCGIVARVPNGARGSQRNRRPCEDAP